MRSVASRSTYPVYLLAGLSDPQPGQRLELAGPEGRHAVTVRRHRVGEELVVTSGEGCWARGPIVEIRGRESLVLAVREAGQQPPADPTITVVQALPKGDRSELAVELLTEVGVDRIVAWQARRCVAKWTPDKAERGLARWRRTAAEATKQSRRVWLPIIGGPVDLGGLVEIIQTAEHCYVLHEGAATSLVDDLAATTAPGWSSAARGDFVLVVGPEGGIGDEELATLVAAGADSVLLGPTVLRTSTAGAVAATLVSAAIGRLGRDSPQGSGSTCEPS